MNKVVNILLPVIILMAAGCDKLVEVKFPKSKILKEAVFSDDVTATSAMLGIYSDMLNDTRFASGEKYSVAGLTAISAREVNHNSDYADFKVFQTYNIRPLNDNIDKLWSSMYYSIYSANVVIEGVAASNGLTEDVKERLAGEALFMRAFIHFYLVNIWGEIPVVTSVDYNINAKVARQPVETVYQQIIADLKAAQQHLPDEYATTERVRPNKATVNALLARVYLYAADWDNAELTSSLLLNDARFALEHDLDRIYLKNSREAIWQLKPDGRSRNTTEGSMYILQFPPTNSFSSPFDINKTLVSSFAATDLRRKHWIDSLTDGSSVFYYPFKYKIRTGGSSSTPPVPLTEYSMVFRLAEQYLIRAEARVKKGNLSGARSDIDSIRVRAGLPLVPNTVGKDELLSIIEEERKHELFTEWGHRWFDLKRWGKADAVFGSVAGWETTDQLYPIPQGEMDRNPFLGKQNDGY